MKYYKTKKYDTKKTVGKKGFVSGLFKATIFSLGMLLALDYFNVPSKIINSYSKFKRDALLNTHVINSINNMSLNSYLNLLNNKKKSILLRNYLSKNTNLIPYIMSDRKIDSTIAVYHPSIYDAVNKVDYVIRSHLSLEDKLEITRKLYKSMPEKERWGIIKYITKDTMGF